ncbi:hypothetical protein CsSME_00054294 [Camellia sinensis var. sinensis]
MDECMYDGIISFASGAECNCQLSLWKQSLQQQRPQPLQLPLPLPGEEERFAGCGPVQIELCRPSHCRYHHHQQQPQSH